MKRVGIVLMFSFCMFVEINHTMLAVDSVPSPLDALAVKLQDQLTRTGNSMRSRDEKLRDRVAAKISSFGESINKENVSEKVDNKLGVMTEEVQRQFNQFRVQLSSNVKDAKERTKLENKLNGLEKKVNAKLASFAGNVKNQSSKALQNISKKASRLSDQVASVLDVNKEKVVKKSEKIVSSNEEEVAVPVCDVAENNAERSKEEISAS